MADLAGKAAIITGAGRGIGRTIAHTLAKRGMQVGINDVNPVTVQQVVDELSILGCRAIPLVASVTNETQVESMFDLVEAELGPVWLLVNNAGIFNSAPTADLTVEMWDSAFEVDAKGVFLCARAAIRRMVPRGQGRIVNIGSIAGQIVRTGQIAYCAAKAAVIHFTRCLAVEVAPHGITVNCLCPGMTWTDMLQVSAKERSLDLGAMMEMIPAGHMAREEDHANLVAFFAMEASAHITGQVVAVDGAQSLYHPLQMKL
jgi:NAD(P)-dependent dehydrogenase (short-subunit alcohol dehydrogenase family)